MNYYFFCNAFIGACLASHAAVINQRTSESRNFLFCRSRCDSCASELSLLDEIPVVSYILLKGRCRYCHAKISSSLVTIEIIGGISFCNIDFASLSGILEAIFLFYFLLAALEDWQREEFSTFLFLPPTLIAIFHYSAHPNAWILPEKIVFTLICCLLLAFVCWQKMGAGDLWAYLILALAYSPIFANQIFLLASLLMLLGFIVNKGKRQQAFIPYLFFSTIYLNLWQ